MEYEIHCVNNNIRKLMKDECNLWKYKRCKLNKLLKMNEKFIEDNKNEISFHSVEKINIVIEYLMENFNNFDCMVDLKFKKNIFNRITALKPYIYDKMKNKN